MPSLRSATSYGRQCGVLIESDSSLCIHFVCMRSHRKEINKLVRSVEIQLSKYVLMRMSNWWLEQSRNMLISRMWRCYLSLVLLSPRILCVYVCMYVGVCVCRKFFLYFLLTHIPFISAETSGLKEQINAVLQLSKALKQVRFN